MFCDFSSHAANYEEACALKSMLIPINVSCYTASKIWPFDMDEVAFLDVHFKCLNI